MDILSGTKFKDVLPEFQEYLRERMIVPERNIPFYALWVSKLIRFLEKNKKESVSRTPVRDFIIQVEADATLADWQIRQADDAVKIYLDDY